MDSFWGRKPVFEGAGEDNILILNKGFKSISYFKTPIYMYFRREEKSGKSIITIVSMDAWMKRYYVPHLYT